ncbi:MAG: rRNA (cytidine1402-2-O)-methyltransferase [Pseudomonadota bacterium]|nr:rRNA (cytidine1402-2-O)-methyltransferase [Pseudomonadota bacterium]
MLYICATPIGNLQDISLRALQVLQQSEVILCENTRNSRYLLEQHNVKVKKLVAFHQHNEAVITEKVIQWLQDGLTVTQISDAGTPGISDPGGRLCSKILELGLPLSPIPGACAYISLVSVSGLTIPHMFYGFLPAKTTHRCKILNQWHDISCAVCIYEAPHRIVECLTDIVKCLGDNRPVILGRELTKQFETIVKTTADELLKFILSDSNQQRGEFVLIIEPVHEDIVVGDDGISSSSLAKPQLSSEQINTLNLLLPELPPKKAVTLTHKITGADKNLLYNYAVQNK